MAVIKLLSPAEVLEEQKENDFQGMFGCREHEVNAKLVVEYLAQIDADWDCHIPYDILNNECLLHYHCGSFQNYIRNFIADFVLTAPFLFKVGAFVHHGFPLPAKDEEKNQYSTVQVFDHCEFESDDKEACEPEGFEFPFEEDTSQVTIRFGNGDRVEKYAFKGTVEEFKEYLERGGKSTPYTCEEEQGVQIKLFVAGVSVEDYPVFEGTILPLISDLRNVKILEMSPCSLASEDGEKTTEEKATQEQTNDEKEVKDFAINLVKRIIGL